MPQLHPLNRCRMCGASSYRPVLDRDATGAMRATGLYRCSGCSVVFADPRAWREGGADEAVPSGPPAAPAEDAAASTSVAADEPPGAQPRAPDWRTYGTVPLGTTG